MKIDIVPVVETAPIHIHKKESTKPTQTIPQTIVVDLNRIFAEFLELEVGDGAASPDTVRNYISHTKQYFNWCRNNSLQPLEADADDIKQYRKFLIDTNNSLRVFHLR